jgi:hypothetical protein
MGNSLLKKEFKEKDVNRIRNLISKKFTEKTSIQGGYTKKSTERVEGEEWEENGKRWTIKNGLKQSITKHDSFKDLIQMPLTCPKCSNPMKLSNINRKMYSIHKMCNECVISMETELKRLGKYEEYRSKMINSNKNSAINDLERFISEYDSFKETYIDSNGDVENWTGTKSNNELDEFKKFVEKLKNQDI